MQYLHGIQACHMAVALGCAEAALFYRELYQRSKIAAGFLTIARRESLAASFRYKALKDYFVAGEWDFSVHWSSREACYLAEKMCRADISAAIALVPPPCVLLPNVSVLHEPPL